MARSGNPSTLDTLTDVDTAGVADTNVLAYDAATSRWIPAAAGSGGGGTGAPTTAPYITTAAVAALSAEVVLGTSIIYAPGTVASMPAASATPAGALYPATDASGSASQGALYRSDGTSAWTRIAIDKGWADALYAALSHNHAASEITSGTIATARLGSGTANAGSVLSGDQTYKQIADAQVASGAAIAVSKISGALVAASNLSDVASAVTSRLNLGLVIGTNVQAYDAELAALAGLTSAADALPYFTGSGTAAVTTLTTFGRSLIDDADAATALTTLGAVIGTNVQAWDADLDALAGLTTAADKLPYFTGSHAAAVATFTAFARTLVDDADAATMRTTLGLVIGTNVQAFDAELSAIAGLTSAADKLPYFTGSGTAALADLSTFARTFIDDADAATVRATLGLVIGTNVQAQDAELAALAGLISAADKVPYFTGSGTAAVADFSSYGRSLVDDADAATARATLGLGSIATQASSSVSITGGSITGITDLAVADGGTGASTRTAALNNIAPATPAKGTILVFDGTNWVNLAVGSDTQVLIADAAQTTGIKWGAAAGGSGSVATDTIWDAKGDLAGGTGADTAARLAVGANNTVLMADSAQTTGMKWIGTVIGTDTLWAAKGDLIAATANDAAAVVSIGSTAQVLRVASGTIAWGALDLAAAAAITGALPIANGGTSQITAKLARGSSGLNVEHMTAVADTSPTAVETDRMLGFTSITAQRTVTLPAASALTAGEHIWIGDESGSLTTAISILIARAGADTINGGTVSAEINMPYGFCELVSDGTSKWTIVKQSPNVQVFTSSGTWTKRPGFATYYARGWGGGASGGGGARRASAAAGGGGGGDSGTMADGWFAAADLSATETVTIPAAATGGALASADSTSGGGGNAGGDTTFGTTPFRIKALGGAAAGTGGTTSGGSAGSATTGQPWSGVAGGAGGTAAGSAGGLLSTGFTSYSPGGGAGGGGGHSSNTDAGGLGGSGWGGAAGGTGGASAGAVGVDGTSSVFAAGGGGGGGAGGSGANTAAGPGGTGGNGGTPGGGGGGGGGTVNNVNSKNSGAGGNGGAGGLFVVGFGT